MSEIFQCCRERKPPKRHATCHCDCEEYRAAKTSHDKLRDSTRTKDADFTDYFVRSVQKAKKKLRKGR